MSTPTVTAAREVTGRRRPRSREAARLVDDLLAVDPALRRDYLHGLADRDRVALLAEVERERGTPFALFSDDPLGFCWDVLGETTWSRQEALLRAVVEHRRVAAPSGFSVSKTHSSARLVVWHCMVNPVGTALAVTTATRHRQVIRQLWPHIRQIVARAGLPAHVDQAQMKMLDRDGTEVVTAYGFSAPPWDSAAVQGIHAGKLLVVIDEAGGISATLGHAMRGLLTGEDTRLLAIGNPAADDEGTWFESLCEEPETHVVRIPSTASPNLTGEHTGPCRACPPEMPDHPLAAHLVDRAWVEETIREHGEDSPFVQAKVHARFPKGGPSRAIPASWIDAAVDIDEPDDAEHVRLDELGLDTERDGWTVRRGAWVRLGVDVAADGGDEFVIARSVGELVHLRHTSSGLANSNATDVAGRVLAEIRAAEALREAIGTEAPVRVKLDAIGVGWGVAGILNAWRSEGLHAAEVVPVVVSERVEREPDSATLRPYRQRDEMWTAFRSLLQPPPGETTGVLRLRVDRRTRAQLGAPTLGTNSSGFATVESKASMKARGLSSPDRAEAVLLCLYEGGGKRRKRARLLV